MTQKTKVAHTPGPLNITATELALLLDGLLIGKGDYSWKASDLLLVGRRMLAADNLLAAAKAAHMELTTLIETVPWHDMPFTEEGTAKTMQQLRAAIAAAEQS